jgi:hypothetical protein
MSRQNGRVLNPGNVITEQIEGEWRNLCCYLLWKLGEDRVTLTSEELMSAPPLFIAVEREEDGMLAISLLDEEDAHRLAQEAGGVPS